MKRTGQVMLGARSTMAGIDTMRSRKLSAVATYHQPGISKRSRPRPATTIARACATISSRRSPAINAAEWIRSTFQYAAEEVSAGRPGSETVLAKLSELLFVEAVRRYAETMPDGQTGWLAGLREPHVARALADRFIRLIGVPPMHYLANWRMQVATQKLRNTSASLAQVAEIVGYDSEAAFSRAFKKAFGAAPATWRRSNS